MIAKSKRIKTNPNKIAISIWKYLVNYKLIYIGIIICNLSCFTFHFILEIGEEQDSWWFTLIILFFLLSFIFPIILGCAFAAKCFGLQSKTKLLSNIIHSYLGTVFIFSAIYYQCCVYGDFTDSINKRESYFTQISLKKYNAKDFSFMRVADQRAFNGIKARMWSGFDYPSFELLLGSPDTQGIMPQNPDSWLNFTNNNFEELSIDQIERIVKNNQIDRFLSNNYSFSKITQYQRQNMAEVYSNCLYFSVICIATVGFGDISPSLWYSKIFVAFEVLIGVSIFIFAIGMLFSNWTIKQE
ncbi:MAG: potassium channel family protein [Chitinophagales bacterium]